MQRILGERSSKIDEPISWGPHWPTAPQDTINLTNGPFRINHTYFAHEIPIFTYVWGGLGSTEGEEEQNICLRLFSFSKWRHAKHCNALDYLYIDSIYQSNDCVNQKIAKGSSCFLSVSKVTLFKTTLTHQGDIKHANLKPYSGPTCTGVQQMKAAKTLVE